MKEMPVSYHRILLRLEEKERRLLNRTPFAPLAAAQANVRRRIPNTVRAGLERAFEKAFALLLSPDGTRFVEHTYAKGKLEQRAALWESPLPPAQAKKTLKELKRSAGLSGTLSNAAAGAEGLALGFLGVGLPDIPVLLA